MSASQSSELLTAGRTCNHSACNTIDFLPFKCYHCTQNFCQEHWKPEQHSCNKYDPATNDRIVPQCPLCNMPVIIPPGRDVNDVMDLHILTDCSVALTKKKRGPHCANSKCGKALISPIICEDCKQQFCPAHRFPSAHTCRPSATTTSSSSSIPTPLRPAGLAAFKRAATNAVSSASTAVASKAKAPAKPSSSNQTNPAASSSRAGSSKPGLIQELKTDRRSKAEEKSRAKAMEVKAKKGLLTPEEKKLWEEAQKDKDSDCVIM